jgi:hypothetical protein
METFPIYGDSLAFELLYAYIWWTAAWVTFHLAIQVVLLLTQRSGVFDSQSMPAIRLSIASITHATVGASVWVYSTAFDKTQLLTAASLAIGYFTVDLAQAQFSHLMLVHHVLAIVVFTIAQVGGMQALVLLRDASVIEVSSIFLNSHDLVDSMQWPRTSAAIRTLFYTSFVCSRCIYLPIKLWLAFPHHPCSASYCVVWIGMVFICSGQFVWLAVHSYSTHSEDATCRKRC